MEFAEQFEHINNYIEKNIAPLNEAELNWKPALQTWSIAQCLDHLIVNNTKYFRSFDDIVNDKYPQTYWQRHSPFTNWFEKKLLEFTAAVPQKKVKAPPSFSPSSGLLDKTIVDCFFKQQNILIQYFNKLAPIANTKKLIISSPFSGIVTFKLNVLLTAFAAHEQRHVSQADKVLHHPQFPKK